MSIDEDLKSALRRKPAPAGFADRVMASIADSQRRHSTPDRWSWLRRAAAVLLVFASVGAWGAHAIVEQRRVEQGERARDQLLVAMQITSSKVRFARHEIQQIGRRPVSDDIRQEP